MAVDFDCEWNDKLRLTRKLRILSEPEDRIVGIIRYSGTLIFLNFRQTEFSEFSDIDMDVVKRKGHKEEFDERKLYASVYAACLSVRCTDEQAENLASITAHETKQHFHEHKEVNSSELRKEAAEVLHRFHPEADYIYETHKDIS